MFPPRRNRSAEASDGRDSGVQRVSESVRRPWWAVLAGVWVAGVIPTFTPAEIVQVRRRNPEPTPPPEAEIEVSTPETAIDPVCGMTVEIAAARHVAEYAGQRFYFCCPGCKRSFEQSPEQYLAPVTGSQ